MKEVNLKNNVPHSSLEPTALASHNDFVRKETVCLMYFIHLCGNIPKRKTRANLVYRLVQVSDKEHRVWLFYYADSPCSYLKIFICHSSVFLKSYVYHTAVSIVTKDLLSR